MVLVQPVGDEPQLVAYVIASSMSPPSSRELARYLAARLPSGMVPTRFYTRDAFPRTLNGKINRSALLPPPAANDEHREPQIVAPRNKVEAQLQEIWRASLGIEDLSVEDDFFESGGHSLTAVQIAANVSREFGIQVPASLLIEAPTVALLAQRVGESRDAPQWQSLINLQPRGSSHPLFCFHADSGLALIYRDLADLLGPKRPVYGVQSFGLATDREPLRDVGSMVEAYLAEIRMVQPIGPYYLAGFCMGAYIALETARRLEMQGERVAFLGSFSTDGEWRTEQGMSFHLRNLSRLEPARRPRYVLERVAYRLTRLLFPAIQKLGLLSRRSPAEKPRWARHLHVQELNRRANQLFMPRRYSGKAVVFQGRADSFRDPIPFWGAMAAGGVEVIPVEGEEAGILRRPNVQILAERLARKLEEAETQASQHMAATAV